METVLRLLVLVPHRDARLPLRAWSDSLFAAGLLSGWSFPGVVPLALLKRPLSAGELRSLAHVLRKNLTLRREGTKGEEDIEENMKEVEGKTRDFHITALCSLCTPYLCEIKSEKTPVWGPTLDIELSDDFFLPVAEAVEYSIAPLVLGAALVQDAVPDKLPAPPQVSFRAAALANMECCFRPCGENDDPVFEWGIGPLQWLPKHIKY